MQLPADFSTTLKTVEDYGILNEDPNQIRNRLALAMQGVASVESGRSVDLGVFDWTTNLLREFEKAIYDEICDPRRNALKDTYAAGLDKALTTDGVQAVSAVVVKVVSVVNPAFAVSSVVIYLSILLLKIGLNAWCAHPPAAK